MGIMPTKTKLALEQTQQGVSNEVLNISTYSDDGNPTIANIKQALRQLKNIKKDGYKCFQDEERYEHVGPKVTSPQEGKRLQDDGEMMNDS
ncbi:hypothetical protein Tco_0459813 [Tanacetum coccineum]